MQAAVTVRTPKNVRQLALIDKVQRQNEAPVAMTVKPKPAMSDAVDSKPLTDQQRPPKSGNHPPRGPPDIKRKPSITNSSGNTPPVPPPPKGRMQPTLPKPTCRPNVAPPPPPPPPPPPVDTDTSPVRGVIQHNDLSPPPPPPPHATTITPADSISEGLDAIPSPPLPSPPILRNTAKNANRGTL